ncbi:unnamed protein product [Chondrus crispus]|uniref:Uncharacterized protein n=1 Tax=Chondrus crispus TaxID=2769 RepID=R7QB87_CHOCR|nr:unnamed protein product [Chondrus crispus]CDF35782.1 unnamed protein product [Chondrus crispus]|eukprot:XP_005715601.1 unnamed protein product [Chondrus crispus]
MLSWCRNLLLLTTLLVCSEAFHELHYIATFNTYHPFYIQESLITSALSLLPQSTWHILPRTNLAARTLPTDFALFESPDPSVLRELRSAPFIRSVTSEGEHGRRLRAFLRNQTSDFEEPDIVDPVSRRAHHRDIPGIHAFGAGQLWRLGFTGEGVKVAVFDTGLISDHTNFAHVVERTNWTEENSTVDVVGHGTFVAGLIAGSHPACPGIAPHASLYAFRVFTGAQVSYTSWFLDAFNYALHVGIDVLNLSIGGPDFADSPFTDKVNELTAHGVIVVSAIGNDGPLWGSLNNPGDMMDVVGVGGAEPDGSIAKFSSRGMTTHELDGIHASYGRVKPDLVAYARSLVGPSHKNLLSCRKLSGTSVASPVVAGAIALLASTVPKDRRRRVVNPASIKRALIQSARKLRMASIYEQGAGLLDIGDAYDIIQQIDAEVLAAMKTEQLQGKGLNIERSLASRDPSLGFYDEDDGENASSIPGPTAAFFPSFYDLTPAGCPQMWPHCAQPLFAGGMPMNLNATVLNPAGVSGRITNITWVGGQHGEFLNVEVTAPKRFWPWAAGLGLHLSVNDLRHRLTMPITAYGVLRVRVVSVHKQTHSDIELPIKASIIPPPQREKRLLWDMFHSIRYPPGYVPRDNLAEAKDMLDWLGDHPHTNFQRLFQAFRDEGFYIDILETPVTCLSNADLKRYGGLLLLDSEDEFSALERRSLRDLVTQHGLALIVAAEWHNADIMREIRFEDDNTRSLWSPIVAGGNVPALNDLLSPFSIAFGDAVVSGNVRLQGQAFRVESGVPIVNFPEGGELLYVSDLALHEYKTRQHDSVLPGNRLPAMPMLGLVKCEAGAVLSFGDTNCIDTAYRGAKCYRFFVEAVRHTISNCAGVANCEKMLHESRILSQALVPNSNFLRQKAAPLAIGSYALLQPHRWFGRHGLTETEPNGEQRLCNMRDELKTWAVLSSGSLSRVKFPQQKKAEPLGSDLNYFRSFRQYGIEMPNSRTGPPHDYQNSLNSLFSSTRVRHLPLQSRNRGLCFLFTGVVLIAFSFVLRRKACSGQHRMYLKRRNNRPRQLVPSVSAFPTNTPRSHALSSVLSIGSLDSPRR